MATVYRITNLLSQTIQLGIHKLQSLEFVLLSELGPEVMAARDANAVSVVEVPEHRGLPLAPHSPIASAH